MTLHRSKGLEYECVWIAHMNEETLMSEKKGGFTLPENIKEHMNKRSIEMAKRELYVAITRAKEYCVLSYSDENYNGSSMELANIINELPDIHFIKKNRDDTEKEILAVNPELYVGLNKEKNKDIVSDITSLVSENYSNIKVSVSMLNNFFECPSKWYFRNFLKLPEPKLVHLSLGSVIHATLEYILKSKSLPTEKEIKDKINYELEKEGIDENNIRKLGKDAYAAISSWIKQYYSHLSSNFQSERSVSFVDKKNFPNLLMYGKIDLSENFPDGSIWITDFKTGSSKTGGVIEKINEEGRMSDLMRQLAMYSYLLKGGRDDINVSKSRLLFIESDINDKNKIYDTFITNEQIDLLKKDIKDYNQSLLDGSWLDRECHFKSYGSNSRECEYCKMFERILSDKK